MAGGVVWLCALSGGAAERWELRDGDRVVFLGDTIFEREVDHGWLEAHLTAAFPDRRILFRNLSWAADSPLGRSRASFDWNKSGSDWLKRKKEQLALVKPTVAILSYGMTAVLERGTNGWPGFAEEMDELVEAVREVSGEPVRWVVVGPIQAAWREAASGEEGRRRRELSAALTFYDSALSAWAAEKGAAFVSFQIGESFLSDPGWSRRDGSGILPNDRGYQGLARMLAGKSLPPGAPEEAWVMLRQAVVAKNEAFFHRWRPANWTYLLGFRKHEQGQNAVEIPRFEPLVEAWDDRIAGLRDLERQDPARVSEAREALRLAKGSTSVAGRSVPTQPQPTFEVHEGLEVTLWAENPMLFKPIQINWDPQGRLWVASSRVYPQVAPGQAAEDAVVVLEDRDGDGVAETSTVFADGLLIPTGVVPDGRGGCYVGASHQLLHFADDDGDLRADRRTVVLSSFGTEDTHHNLHTLRWGYDGHLYMAQSIYTHTHVETPWGVRRLNSGGIWRFQPDTWRLEVFTRGACNPWGHHWDQYGHQFFTDGAGFKGVYHAMEGATYFTYADMRREAASISPGNHPKFCSLELLHSPAFPEDWQGQLVTCDFRAHRVVRFGLEPVGSTFRTVEQPDLLRSTNVTFRPIDLRLGPDGALYVSDWSNPIIQHGEVDFRDARRDKEHGRIWRVAAKPGYRGARRVERVGDLSRLETAVLLDRTLSASGWEQEQARLVLRQRGGAGVREVLEGWLSRQTDPRAPLEVMWLREALGWATQAEVEVLVKSSDARLRAAAARQLGR
jgi:glucose/arabinose dehydrogenase